MDNTTPEVNPEEHGSPVGFGVGLVLGAFFGVTSYYWFHTKEGEEKREELVKKLEEVRDKWEDQLKAGGTAVVSGIQGENFMEQLPEMPESMWRRVTQVFKLETREKVAKRANSKPKSSAKRFYKRKGK
jgi:hypothetical protein